jgi:hypothetical protein
MDHITICPNAILMCKICKHSFRIKDKDMHNCVEVLKDIIREKDKELYMKNDIVEKLKHIEEKLTNEMYQLKEESDVQRKEIDTLKKELKGKQTDEEKKAEVNEDP